MFSKCTLYLPGNRPTRPEVTISPKSYEIQEGQPIEFRCTAIGNPAPTLRWTRVDGPLNPRVSQLLSVIIIYQI